MVKRNDNLPDNLVRKAINGDRDAFSKIVELMMTRVLGLTYRMTQNRETAADLAQETFISAWEKISSFRSESRLESWLYSIASNKSLNYLTSANHRLTDHEDDQNEAVSETANPEKELHRTEMRNNVLGFMKSLPPQQREVFNLRFYHQMKFEEIAGATSRALGTVKTNYREAVKKLRETAIDKGWTV